MKTVGLITEYNPFHNGHLYHIQKAKEITQADNVIVVMSGNYVQRGTPAIMPKHIRTEMALRSGASIVIELPVRYATASAEIFAMGAVGLLHQLGCVDSLCFGSECGDLKSLSDIAWILQSEPKEYREALHQNLKQGMSFPSARHAALLTYTSNQGLQLATVIDSPNNILGIEYLKALYRLNSHIVPFTIKRQGSNYHDTELQTNFSSASAIRNLLAYSGNSYQKMAFSESDYEYSNFSSILSELEMQVPKSCLELLLDNHQVRYPVYANDFSLLLKYKLLQETNTSLTTYADVSEDIANRMINHRNRFLHFEQFCELIKTKDITYSRVSRSLLHILLGITNQEYAISDFSKYHYYVHILGFRKDASKLLHLLKKESSLPILTKLKNTDTLCNSGKQMLLQDIFTSNLYESIITDKYKTAFINEYEQSIIRI
ncbi:nucleotidyltransferase [Lachnospiraceae bacterium LCP25S3_G4]